MRAHLLLAGILLLLVGEARGAEPPRPAPPPATRWYEDPGCDPDPLPPPRSLGSASDGRLEDGRPFPDVPGAVALKRHVFGTVETIAYLLAAIDQVRAELPGTPPLAVGHLSRKGGGHLSPHRSHQSGRDVDAGYYHLDGPSPPRWQVATRRNLDVPRTWRLFEALLETGRVRFLFVDYGLQALLYRHAKAKGVPGDRLAQVFQYPRGRRTRVGLIRHERGHRDHFHVRFDCPVGDEECEP